jgi:AraC-like DNA-binding protein
MPMCILKDYYAKRTRTHLISFNDNIVRPNNKPALSFTSANMRAKNIFSSYHFHDGIEILRISKGSAVVLIGEKTFEANENDILIVNPFEAHGIYLTDPLAEFERSCFIFRPADLFPDKKKSNLPLYDMLLVPGFENYISNKEVYSKELCCCLDRIIEAVSKSNNGWQVAVLGQLVMFYSVMIREGLQKESSATMPYQLEFMTRVSDFIEENLHREISTRAIANHCLYSVEHFCRLFKKCFNKTFKEYLNICRIQRARDLIDTGQAKSVWEASKLSGFKNANHFCNIFKNIVGTTPSEYIKERNGSL